MHLDGLAFLRQVWELGFSLASARELLSFADLQFARARPPTPWRWRRLNAASAAAGVKMELKPMASRGLFQNTLLGA